MSQGKLIVIEGIDGAGKSTQLARLLSALSERGVHAERIAFPKYGTPGAALVEEYLGGRIGRGDERQDPKSVNAYAASLFFACDRYISYKNDGWRDVLDGGGIVITDRYTTSNAVHQGGKLPEGEREEYFRWLYDTEFGKMGLPKPDAVILLDLTPEQSAERLRARNSRDGTSSDIHEKDGNHLKNARESALFAAKALDWTVIPAQGSEDEVGGRILSAALSVLGGNHEHS
ncbi:MAG: thymidylate kinase [Oscillospiraceae bacterium]|jgi:dTMP kinase|nr:thymidylate kinase [Oscillospiraceae bacterium]